jgi:hypothetical protein
MDVRDDPWAFGDRLAWEAAEPVGDDETIDVIRRLRGHLASVATTPGQVIHGDILPNVLVADGLPPAVIDWPPYFRPVGTANAVAVTDAVTFRGASLSLLDEWETGEDWNQLLVRALLYRLGPTGLFASRNRLMGSQLVRVGGGVLVPELGVDLQRDRPRAAFGEGASFRGERTLVSSRPSLPGGAAQRTHRSMSDRGVDGSLGVGHGLPGQHRDRTWSTTGRTRSRCVTRRAPQRHPPPSRASTQQAHGLSSFSQVHVGMISRIAQPGHIQVMWPRGN